jgi:NADH:ubiquinone reductase (H+-translocating)
MSANPPPAAPSPTTGMPFDPGEGRVVILGGGYAGVATARDLLRRKHPGEKITLVDREPTTTFRTELYKVGESLSGGQPWVFPFDRTGLARSGVRFVQGDVGGVDLTSRQVKVGATSLPFDALVVALGCVPAYYGIPGCEANSFEIYTVRGAQALARKLAEALPAAVASGELKVLIAGGGATGVELGAYLATANWPEVLKTSVRPLKVTVLTGPAPFLAGLPDALIARARKEITKAGVEIVQGGQVVSVGPGHVEFKDLPARDTDLFVWCGGLRAPDAVASMTAPLGPGKRLKVTPFLEVEGHPGVFALGDSSALLDPVDGTPVPSTAQAALEEAPVAAQNILARLHGRKFQVFHYEPRGVAVAVGQGRAVAAIGHRVVGGRLAGAIKGFIDREYHAEVRGIAL